MTSSSQFAPSGNPVSRDLAHIATTCNIHPMRYQIDGSRFATLEEFFEEVSRVLIPGEPWGRNLDAFNDILRRGFGTPSDGFTIDWKNHALSRQRLGYDETVRQLEIRLGVCHPESRDKVLNDLERARAHQGPTVFDWLVEIIRIHVEAVQKRQTASIFCSTDVLGGRIPTYR